MAKGARRLPALLVLVLIASLVLVGPANAANPNADNTKVKVLIGFDRQPGPAEQSIVRGAGGSVRYTYRLIPAVAASVPQAALDGLRRNPRIKRIEPDLAVRAAVELQDSWGVERIGAPIVHGTGNTGFGVKVAIIDSGIDYLHPDLDANYAGGYDFVNGDNDPMDDNGHGTHVAGIVAAEANGAGVVGVAPGARVYALKVLGADGGGYYSDVIAAIEWAVSNGIQVTNNSYGSSGYPGDLTKQAFDNSYAAGLIHVAAAGNSGNPPGNRDTVEYPGRFASTIAVASTDINNIRASSSSTGPDVELAAPGVGIKSTVPNNGYAVYSGTSMASPHVAGTVALMIAGGITGVRSRLQSTADDLGATGRDWRYGYGLVDADEAALPPNEAPSVAILQPTDGATFDSGATVVFNGTASDTEDGDLTGSLVWSSSIDGSLGTGGSLSRALSDGNHTITAEASDSGGKTGTASVRITVGNPPSVPTTVGVSSITYAIQGGKNNTAHLLVTVSLVDNLGAPVANASVAIDEYRNSARYASRTAVTGTNGRVVFKFKNAPSGTYSTTVTGVTAAGLTWDGVTPPNQFTK